MSQPPQGPQDPQWSQEPPWSQDPQGGSGPQGGPPPWESGQYANPAPSSPPFQPQPGPSGSYGAPGYPPPPTMQPGPGRMFADNIGPRTLRRPMPRFGTALAAAGVVLVIAGVLIWSADYLISDIHVSFDENGLSAGGSNNHRFLGAGLSFLAVVIGYVLMVARRRGPLATAGAIAAAVGVPLTLLFLTLDVKGVFEGKSPINIDLVLLVSVLVWLVTYVFVPGAQGRAFFLGLAALYLADWAEYKAAPSQLFGAALRLGGGNAFGAAPSHGGTGGVAAVALIFGLVYYGVAVLLDRRGRTGASVAFVVAGFVNTVTGVAAVAPDFHKAGTGVLLIVIGAALCWYGARFGRRFTAWSWAAGIVLGIGLIVADALPDNAAGAGITFIIIGLVVVVLAQVLANVTQETDDVDELSEPAYR